MTKKIRQAYQADWIGLLRDAGLTVVSYLPENSLLLRGSEAALVRGRGFAFVEWMGPYLPEYKQGKSWARSEDRASWQALNPVAGKRDAPGRMAFDGIPPDQLNVMTPRAEDAESVRHFLETHGAVVTAVSTSGVKGFLRTEIPPSLVDELTARADWNCQ